MLGNARLVPSPHCHTSCSGVGGDVGGGFWEVGGMVAMSIAYAGIGSRKTPPSVCAEMTFIAKTLAAEGFLLRSGGAEGADTAFEQGSGAAKEIYRPSDVTSAALTLAERFHPNWSRCSYPAKLLLARNGFQVLGPDLTSPSAAVICWTPDGKFSGGTGQALRIADAYGISIFNLFYPQDGWAAVEFLRRLIRPSPSDTLS